MKNFEFIPPKRTFEQDFILENKNLFTLKYEQATLQEFFEFYGKSKEIQIQELLELINSQIPFSNLERVKKRLIKNYKTEIEMIIDYEKLLINILNNRFRTHNSMFEWVSTGTSWKKTPSLMRNSFAQVCNFWNVSFDDLIEKYTIEQFLWLLDWVRFENNNQSKDWKNINYMAMQDVDGRKKRAEETKKAFENFKT